MCYQCHVHLFFLVILTSAINISLVLRVCLSVSFAWLQSFQRIICGASVITISFFLPGRRPRRVAVLSMNKSDFGTMLSSRHLY